MDYVFDLSVFTPKEAEAITGVSTTLQRDWRRRKFLPVVEGHMRFNILELSRLWAIKLLADRGIGPATSTEVTELIAEGIAFHALASSAAFEGEHPAIDQLPKTSNAFEMRKALEDLAEKARPGDKFDLSGAPVAWMASTNQLARTVLRQFGTWKGSGRVLPARFFIWFADGSHNWVASIDSAFFYAESEEIPERLTGAIAILDQYALGRTLMERANRPFVCISPAAEEQE
jgi:hypothetical protein